MNHTVWTPEQKEGAYTLWRKIASLRRVSDQLNIPLSTLTQWSRADGWVMRRREDDDRDREIMILHARMRLSGEADRLVDNLLDLAFDAKNEQVKFAATKYAMAVLGMEAVTKSQVTVEEKKKIEVVAPRKLFSDEERKQLGRDLLGLESGDDEDDDIIDIESNDEDE